MAQYKNFKNISGGSRYDVLFMHIHQKSWKSRDTVTFNNQVVHTTALYIQKVSSSKNE